MLGLRLLLVGGLPEGVPLVVMHNIEWVIIVRSCQVMTSSLTDRQMEDSATGRLVCMKKAKCLESLQLKPWGPEGSCFPRDTLSGNISYFVRKYIIISKITYYTLFD